MQELMSDMHSEELTHQGSPRERRTDAGRIAAFRKAEQDEAVL